MSGNKIVKSVSFNVMNEQDIAYLERIKDINFSGYVKRLIEKDIRHRKVIKAEIKSTQDSHTMAGLVITKGTSLSLIPE